VHRAALPAPPQPAATTEVERSTRHRRVLIDASAGFETAAVYDRAALAAGTRITGPAIVEQADTTTLIPAGWRCRVAEAGHLLIEPSEPHA
jgi:N-methylhydantoinase A